MGSAQEARKSHRAGTMALSVVTWVDSGGRLEGDAGARLGKNRTRRNEGGEGWLGDAAKKDFKLMR